MLITICLVGNNTQIQTDLHKAETATGVVFFILCIYILCITVSTTAL